MNANCVLAQIRSFVRHKYTKMKKTNKNGRKLEFFLPPSFFVVFIFGILFRNASEAIHVSFPKQLKDNTKHFVKWGELTQWG